MSGAGVPYPLQVPDPHGRPMTWRLYPVRFASPDGTYHVHLYAISDDHAALQVQALRETATLDGRTVGVEPTGDA